MSHSLRRLVLVGLDASAIAAGDMPGAWWGSLTRRAPGMLVNSSGGSRTSVSPSTPALTEVRESTVISDYVHWRQPRKRLI